MIYEDSRHAKEFEMNEYIEVAVVFTVVILVFMLGYLRGIHEGRRAERTIWVRWIIVQLKGMQIYVEEEDRADLLKELIKGLE